MQAEVQAADPQANQATTGSSSRVRSVKHISFGSATKAWSGAKGGLQGGEHGGGEQRACASATWALMQEAPQGRKAEARPSGPAFGPPRASGVVQRSGQKRSGCGQFHGAVCSASSGTCAQPCSAQMQAKNRGWGPRGGAHDQPPHQPKYASVSLCSQRLTKWSTSAVAAVHLA